MLGQIATQDRCPPLISAVVEAQASYDESADHVYSWHHIYNLVHYINFYLAELVLITPIGIINNYWLILKTMNRPITVGQFLIA